MNTNITELAANLRGLAEAATPGPNHIYTHHRDDKNWQNNEAWHAACEPQTFITILDALEAAQAEVAALTLDRDEWKTACEGAIRLANTQQERADTALARLAELEKQEPIARVTNYQGGFALNYDGCSSGALTAGMSVYAAAGASPVQPRNVTAAEDAILRAATLRAGALVSKGRLVQPSQAPNPMTAERAAYFMRRFKHEEKLLGPNEQAAVDYVIALLEQPSQKWTKLPSGLPTP